MKTRAVVASVVLLLAVTAVAVAAASAAAPGTKLEGRLKHSGGKGHISMVIQMRNGKPKRAVRLRFDNIPYRCKNSGRKGYVDLNEPKAAISKSVYGKHSIARTWHKGKMLIDLNARLNRAGTKATGEIGLVFSEDHLSDTCSSTDLNPDAGAFKATTGR